MWRSINAFESFLRDKMAPAARFTAASWPELLLFTPDVHPDVDGVPPAKEDQSESTSDSDDCIIQAQTTGRKVGL